MVLIKYIEIFLWDTVHARYLLMHKYKCKIMFLC